MSSQTSSISDCSICLAPPTEPVKTNCGHIFCGQCIVNYWRSDRYTRPCKCPLCRRKITLLIPVNGRISRSRSALQADINEYNRRQNTHSQPLFTQLMDTPTLVTTAISQLFNLRGLSCCSRLYIILCMLLVMVYLISPIDLIPEVIFGPFGLLDDIGSLVVAAVYIANILRQDVLNR